MREGKTFRPAIFVVAYSINEKNIPEFILLKRQLHWKGWEFCKGKIEKGEKQIDAVKRELKEETGISINTKDIVDHKIAGKYFYPKWFTLRPGKMGQTYHLYSVKVKKPKTITLDPLEHNGHKWVTFEKAIKLITYPNQRQSLRIVKKFIDKKI